MIERAESNIGKRVKIRGSNTLADGRIGTIVDFRGNYQSYPTKIPFVSVNVGNSNYSFRGDHLEEAPEPAPKGVRKTIKLDITVEEMPASADDQSWSIKQLNDSFERILDGYIIHGWKIITTHIAEMTS